MLRRVGGCWEESLQSPYDLGTQRPMAEEQAGCLQGQRQPAEGHSPSAGEGEFGPLQGFWGPGTHKPWRPTWSQTKTALPLNADFITSQPVTLDKSLNC